VSCTLPLGSITNVCFHLMLIGVWICNRCLHSTHFACSGTLNLCSYASLSQMGGLGQISATCGAQIHFPAAGHCSLFAQNPSDADDPLLATPTGAFKQFKGPSIVGDCLLSPALRHRLHKADVWHSSASLSNTSISRFGAR
jgi:hypothetical protein